MKRPNKKDFNFNDKIDSVIFAKQMIDYADYLESQLQHISNAIPLTQAIRLLESQLVETHCNLNKTFKKRRSYGSLWPMFNERKRDYKKAIAILRIAHGKPIEHEITLGTLSDIYRCPWCGTTKFNKHKTSAVHTHKCRCCNSDLTPIETTKD